MAYRSQDFLSAFTLLVAGLLSGVQPAYNASVVHHGRVYATVNVQANFTNRAAGWDEISDCTLAIVGKEAKERVLAKLSHFYPIEEVDFETMLSIVNTCESLQQQPAAAATSPRPVPPHPVKSALYSNQPPAVAASSVTLAKRKKVHDLSLFAMLKGIVPGTKWCGVNDIADSYHDLGKDFHLDKCCRAHDHCPIKIKAFTENFGVRNYHPYTKSHCACDDLFYACLKQTGDEKALAVGNLFFNVMALQCAEPVFPTVCVEKAVITKPRHYRESRLLFSLFGRSADGKSDDGLPASGQQQEEQCVKWQVDKDAPPKIKFRVPKKYF